ncbi:hypothetical protein GGI35DRAFT_436247 [Trichoderma velutinum]
MLQLQLAKALYVRYYQGVCSSLFNYSIVVCSVVANTLMHSALARGNQKLPVYMYRSRQSAHTLHIRLICVFSSCLLILCSFCDPFLFVFCSRLAWLHVHTREVDTCILL